MESHTKKSTRIVIWVIAIVMAAGFVLTYFVMIMQNNETANQTLGQASTQQEQPQLQYDPSAYKVEGKVNELQITDLTAGTGTEAKMDDLITIHYKGTLAQTGEKFDSSFDSGEPITCKISNFIPGWQQGIPGMKENGKRRLVIPASLAYGETGSGSIPANSDLVFEVELLKVNPQNTPNQCEM